MAIASEHTYGDTNLSAAPALAKGDALSLALGGADAGSTVATARVECTVEDVSDKAIKVIAPGMRWGAWFPKALLRGWSVHCFRDASCDYYRASLHIPRGFKASTGQAMLLRSARCDT